MKKHLFSWLLCVAAVLMVLTALPPARADIIVSSLNLQNTMETKGGTARIDCEITPEGISQPGAGDAVVESWTLYLTTDSTLLEGSADSSAAFFARVNANGTKIYTETLPSSIPLRAPGASVSTAIYDVEWMRNGSNQALSYNARTTYFYRTAAQLGGRWYFSALNSFTADPNEIKPVFDSNSFDDYRNFNFTVYHDNARLSIARAGVLVSLGTDRATLLTAAVPGLPATAGVGRAETSGPFAYTNLEYSAYAGYTKLRILRSDFTGITFTPQTSYCYVLYVVDTAGNYYFDSSHSFVDVAPKEMPLNVWLSPAGETSIQAGDALNLSFGADEAAEFTALITNRDTLESSAVSLAVGVTTGDYALRFDAPGAYSLAVRAASGSRSETSDALFVTVQPAPNGQPWITEAAIENVSNTGYDVVVYAQDDQAVQTVLLKVWHSGISENEAVVTESAWPGGDSARIHVSVDSLNGAVNTIYHTVAVVTDGSGAESAPVSAREVYVDGQAPVFAEAKISHVEADYYEVTCKAQDETALMQLQLAVWNEQLPVENAVWLTAPLYLDECTFRISASDFGGAQNISYYTCAYAIDQAGNYASLMLDDVFLDAEAPSMVWAEVQNVTTAGFNIYAESTDNHSVAGYLTAVWPDSATVDSAVWNWENSLDTGALWCYVDLAALNQPDETLWHAQVYAVDGCGNISEPSPLEVTAQDPYQDTEKPTVVWAEAQNVTVDGFNVYAEAVDNAGVAGYPVALWTDDTTIDNAVWKWVEPNENGAMWTYFDLTAYGSPLGAVYHVGVMASDTSENGSDLWELTVTVPSTPPDTEDPQVVWAEVQYCSATGFCIYGEATDNVGVTGYVVGVWNENEPDNAIWWSVDPTENGTLWMEVGLDYFGGAVNTTYQAEVYALDGSGRYNPEPWRLSAYLENVPPVMADLYLNSISAEGYIFTARAEDNVGVAYYMLGTWHDQMSADDAHWDTVNADENGQITYCVNTEEFGVQNVIYHTWIFPFDTCGNVCQEPWSMDWNLETVPPVMEQLEVLNITPFGFEVAARASDNVFVNEFHISLYRENDQTAEDGIWFNVRADENGAVRFYVDRESNQLSPNTPYSLYADVNDGCHNPSEYALLYSGLVLPENNLYYMRDPASTMETPASMQVIEPEAFAGVAARYFVLGGQVRQIGSGAFPQGAVVFVWNADSIDIAMDAIAVDGKIVEMGTYSEALANRLQTTPHTFEYIHVNDTIVP